MDRSFPALDFRAYHAEELPRLLAEGRGQMVAAAAAGLRSLAFRLREGEAFTYRPESEGLAILAGDAEADTVIELDAEAWQGLVHELEAPAGLLYAGRLTCRRGQAMQLMAWEAALRALYNGRPAYDPAHLDLRDAKGARLDPSRSFRLEDAREEMAHFLKSAGYLFLRGVFDADEIAAFRAESDELRAEARKGDKLSWWARKRDGREVLCRVTRANARPHLAALPRDPRLLALVGLAEQELVHNKGEGEGVTLIYKHPCIAEGLSDIPWHRDCGMGGHATLCPVLLASVFLSEASPETGELCMVPGSWQSSLAPRSEGAPPLAGVHFHARPGDVSLHYGDTIHAAPPPTAPDLPEYRSSAVVAFARPSSHHHRGEGSYNDVLHQREDGQVEHLAKVANRSKTD